MLELLFHKIDQILLSFAICRIRSNARISFGLYEPIKTTKETMEWAESKLQGLKILNIEVRIGPMAQILFTTMAQITFLEIVSIRPISLYFPVHYIKEEDLCENKKSTQKIRKNYVKNMKQGTDLMWDSRCTQWRCPYPVLKQVEDFWPVLQAWQLRI